MNLNKRVKEVDPSRQCISPRVSGWMAHSLRASHEGNEGRWQAVDLTKRVREGDRQCTSPRG